MTAEAYYFPLISSDVWENASVKTLDHQRCLGLKLSRSGASKSYLTHCATALQGYLFYWAKEHNSANLWRGAHYMTTSCDTVGSALLPCPPLPAEWGRELGGFQRYAIAVTAKDNHLKFQTLWRAFLWLGDRDTCIQFLYQNLGKRATNAFLDYVFYLAVDPDLRQRESFDFTPPAPTEFQDMLLGGWVKFCRQQTQLPLREKH